MYPSLSCLRKTKLSTQFRVLSYEVCEKSSFKNVKEFRYI